MEGVVRLVVEIVGYLWPFRAVEQWERGVYYVFGRYWRTVGPGRWPVIPYFMNVIAVSVVPVPVSCPLQTITTKSGGTLTFSATATVCVTDAAAALNAVDQYKDSVVELVSALLAEELAEKPDEQLHSSRLETSLRTALNKQTTLYGIEVQAVRFANFAMNLRTYRLLVDSAVVTQAGW